MALKNRWATGRRSKAALKVPGVDALPAGMSIVGSDIEVSGSIATLENWDFDGRRLLVKSGGAIGVIRNCLFGERKGLANLGGYIFVQVGGSVDLIEYCDITGWAGPRNAALGGNMHGAGYAFRAEITGSGAGIQVGDLKAVRRCRFTNLPSDILKITGCQSEPQVFEWNYVGPAAGFKYMLHADQEKQDVVTPGIRYQAENGHRGVLQGGADELSPFVSLAKGYGDLHLVSNLTLRVPLGGGEGNTVGHWDVHLDYDVNPGKQAVFAPLLEVHGVHYLDDGNSALNVGGLDYTNLGSQPAKHFVCWAGIGARLEIVKRFELGFAYEFALTDPDDDIMDDRITIDFITANASTPRYAPSPSLKTQPASSALRWA